MKDIVSPAVRAVCERHGAAVDLVMERVYSFIDVSSQWNLTLAALCGHQRLVQRLSAERPCAFDRCCTEAMDSAAEFGHLVVVQWLHENRQEGCTTDAMDMAAGNGHLKIVQWLHEHRSEDCTTLAMDFAAQNGHLAVIKWLHEHRKEGCTSLAIDNAAKEGHLDVIKYLHEHRQAWCTRSAFRNACGDGHLEVAQWLLTNRPNKCSIMEGLETAMTYGHQAVAAWLREASTTMDWDSDTNSSDVDEEADKMWLWELDADQLGDRLAMAL